MVPGKFNTALIYCAVSPENSILQSPQERGKTAIVSGGRNRTCNRHMAEMPSLRVKPRRSI